MKSRLASVNGMNLSPESISIADGLEFGLAREDGDSKLLVLAPERSDRLGAFEGEISSFEGGALLVGPTSSGNAAALRDSLPWLRPRTLGLGTSAGLGDRLGLATSGHVRAIKAVGGDIAPIFAQQSIREMERTGRGPRAVMDDATWGVFSEGWTGGCGADADHLKNSEDVDACLAAGYTFFTFDPGEFVDDEAESETPGVLRDALGGLPWEALEDSASDLRRRYLTRAFDLEGHSVCFDEHTLHVAAVKYGRAVAHASRMFRHLESAAGGREFEVEVSVDETASPTTHAQHVYIASELSRLGVRWISLAPRYLGAFEKGVDYMGDVEAFEKDFAVHAAIARKLGPYKLSLHSGSDKFSVYPAAARQTRGLVHLKTAGTSYLEALRTLAALDPDLFREIYAFSRKRYEEDRASYHVSAGLENAPGPDDPADGDLPELLNQFDARQILHVTFGSVLRDPAENIVRCRDRFMAFLRAHPEPYAANLESHFSRHLEPFTTEAGSGS